MPTYLAKLLLLFLAGAFIWWHVRTVRAAARRSPEDADIQQAVLIPAVVMTLALACNALAFMGDVSLAWEIGISEDPRGGAADLIHLLMRQVSVLVGTGALMMVIQRALGRGWEGLERRPKIVGVMVQERYYRELMRRHWWAVLGAGTVFGVAGGTGPVLLLAVELTLMWAGCRMIMAFTKRPE